jgi:hypothetical protein
MQLQQKVALGGFDPIAPEQFLDFTEGGLATLEAAERGA